MNLKNIIPAILMTLVLVAAAIGYRMYKKLYASIGDSKVRFSNVYSNKFIGETIVFVLKVNRQTRPVSPVLSVYTDDYELQFSKDGFISDKQVIQYYYESDPNYPYTLTFKSRDAAIEFAKKKDLMTYERCLAWNKKVTDRIQARKDSSIVIKKIYLSGQQ